MFLLPCAKIDVVGSCCIVQSSAQCSTMIEQGDAVRRGRRLQEGGAIYILRADSLCSISETNMTLFKAILYVLYRIKRDQD